MKRFMYLEGGGWVMLGDRLVRMLSARMLSAPVKGGPALSPTTDVEVVLVNVGGRDVPNGGQVCGNSTGNNDTLPDVHVFVKYNGSTSGPSLRAVLYRHGYTGSGSNNEDPNALYEFYSSSTSPPVTPGQAFDFVLGGVPMDFVRNGEIEARAQVYGQPYDSPQANYHAAENPNGWRMQFYHGGDCPGGPPPSTAPPQQPPSQQPPVQQPPPATQPPVQQPPSSQQPPAGKPPQAVVPSLIPMQVGGRLGVPVNVPGPHLIPKPIPWLLQKLGL